MYSSTLSLTSVLDGVGGQRHTPAVLPPEISGTHCTVGTAVAQWLRCCATNRQVADSIPDGVIGIFH